MDPYISLLKFFFDKAEWAPLHVIYAIETYTSTFIEGVIPGILVTVFSLLASRRLKKLAENFPGERNHHMQLTNNRYLTAKTLIVFVILFLVSYVPQRILIIVTINSYIKFDSKAIYNFQVDRTKLLYARFFTSVISYLNSALNPVVLYFLSSNFRQYFKSYLHCRSNELN